MKIRLHGTSVRLRLSVSEIAAFARGEGVESGTHFPDGSVLGCRLALGAGTEPTVCFVASQLEVVVPREAGVVWAAGEEITMAWNLEAADAVLRLLVEKDLPCSHRPSVSVTNKECS